jgi:hypothetical protein
MTAHKLLHDGTFVGINVLDGQHFVVESWHCLTHMTAVNRFQKCGFSKIKPRAVKMQPTQLSTAEDDWGQLKADYHFKYIL